MSDSVVDEPPAPGAAARESAGECPGEKARARIDIGCEIRKTAVKIAQRKDARASFTSEGELMPNDFRNAKVVIVLMFAMTAGAALLRWMEPRGALAADPAALLAQTASNIRSVTIEYAGPGRGVDPATFDALILPDGQMSWRARSQDVRIALVGDESPRVPEAQARQLLSILGRIRAEGGDGVPVTLGGQSDVRENRNLPAQAADLRELLVRKAFIE